MIEPLLLTLVAAYAYSLGQCVLAIHRISLVTPAGQIAAGTSLGLGIVAHVVLALGLAGYLTRGIVLGTGAIVLSLALGARWFASRRRRNWCRTHGLTRHSPSEPAPSTQSKTRNRKSKIITAAQALLVAVTCVGTLTSALAPPTAGDALCYHLDIPKRFVEHGAVRYLPLTDNSLFPFHTEMLYTLALLLGTPVLAQLMHWLVGLLFALAVVELATPLVGRSYGQWAAIVALLVPGVTNQMTAPLNDLTVALFCTLMLCAWVRWQATFAWRWLVLAGLWGGFGIGAKLVAAGVVGMVALSTLVVSLRRQPAHTNPTRQRGDIGGPRWRVGLVSAGAFLAIVCLIGGIWYARSWYYWGNPIYPYFNSFFGLESHTRSLLITTKNPVTLPWLATMHPESFGGRGVQFGAVFLALLPGLMLVKWHPHLRTLMGIAAGFAALWFAVRQELRFLLPIVGVLSVAVVAVVRGLRARYLTAHRACIACLACLLSFQTLIVLKRARPSLAVAWGFESRESFLERHEPSYKVARFANAKLPRGSRLISQDYRGLYFEVDFVREAALHRYWPYDERGGDLVGSLVAFGFTHVLLVAAHNPDTAVYDAAFAERLGSAVDRLHLLLASHFEGPGGDRRDYWLYELPSRNHPVGSINSTASERPERSITDYRDPDHVLRLDAN